MVLNFSFHVSITATILHLYTVSAHKPSLVLTLYFLQLRCRKNRLVVEWLLLSRGGLKPTLIRIERMKRVLDAVKRCDSEGSFQWSFLTYRFVPPPVLSFWVTDPSRTHADF